MAFACFFAFAADVCAQSVHESGLGRHAVSAIHKNDEHRRTEMPSTRPLNLGAALGSVSSAADILQADSSGRLILFNIANLSDEDLRNPFEIRVQVRVDMREVRIEIGGIVESEKGQNSAIIYVKPVVVASGKESPFELEKKRAEKKPASASANTAASKRAAAQKDVSQEKGTRYLCSVGDTMEGFSVAEIQRDYIVVETLGNHMRIPRDRPVTVCIPLSRIK
jgi:hypothetical protein